MSLQIQSRHSNRAIHKSRRARESDEYIPGIDSTIQRLRETPSVTPEKKGSDLHSSISSRLDQLDLSSQDKMSSRNPNQDISSILTPPRSPSQSQRASTDFCPDTSVDIKSEGDDTNIQLKKKAPSQRGTRGVARKVQRGRGMRATNQQQGIVKSSVASRVSNIRGATAQPGPRTKDFLEIISLDIYPWPQSRPTDLTSITKEQHAWRVAQNLKDKLEDDREDHDLDDWHQKSGNALTYSESKPGWALQYSIARSFILRAKRAHRAEQTWQAFEDAKLAIDSMSEARAIEDPELRKIHMEEAIDNHLRLKIFSFMRRRLCLEIWSDRYVERWLLEIDDQGLVEVVKVTNETPSRIVKLSIPSMRCSGPRQLSAEEMEAAPSKPLPDSGQ